jgi:hypothetical protein
MESLSIASRSAKMVFLHPSSLCCEDDLQKISLDPFLITKADQHEEIGSEDEDYIYHRPIVIPPIPAIIHSDSPASKIAVMSVIVFNLALAHHLHGISDPGPCSSLRRFSKAAKLYKIGFKLQACSQDYGVNFYSMAVLNNLGQVFRAANEEEKASHCFSHLLSTLACLMERHGGNDHSIACVDGFFRTTSHLVLKEKEAAAAAA